MPPRSSFRKVLSVATLAAILGTATPSAGEERCSFIGVALDRESQEADQKLQDFLYRKAEVSFAPENLEYGRVIERLANWRAEDGPYVARVTPYVSVVAEMLGASFEPIATYVSASTGKTTYHSYLVVRRDDFDNQPDLADVIRFVQQHGSPASFVYHSKFSTSSFFLPSLVFRSNKIFHMPESTESLTAIVSRPIPESSSSRLVEWVARGDADLAAVWDGSKSKFEPQTSGARYREFGSRVFFVRLPTALPNDLLVCSSALKPEVKLRLQDAIASMTEDQIGIGDFKTWTGIREATPARLALADLRWSARQRVAPVTVDPRLVSGSFATSSASSVMLQAARQAVRLAGTEFVLYDQDFHEHIDFVWSLEAIHDGAVKLSSAIPGSEIEDQVFRISFQDTEDLTRRIATLVQSRLHRIRYAWPYSDDDPVVIRDMAFSIPVGAMVKVQRISWLDPERNKYRAGPIFDAAIRQAGFYKYVLDADSFPNRSDMGLDLDAMSNVSYRVLLLRNADEPLVFRFLSAFFVILLVAAAGLATLTLVRPRDEEWPTLDSPPS